MVSIVALCGAVVAFFAVSLSLPAVSALITEDWLAFEIFLLLAVGYGLLSGLTIMALAPRLRRLTRAGVFIAAGLMWVSLSVAASLPFILIEGASPASAIFEAVSGLVTLGVTTRPLGDISAPMALYRGLIAWQGGLLTLILAIYVMGRYEVGGTPNRHLRYILHSSESGSPRFFQTFVEVFIPYTAITLACAAALVVARMTPIDAFNVALNVISTNGFVPLQTGATVLNNFAGEIIMMIFMMIGATSIIWHRSLINRRWAQAAEQTEARAFLILAAVLIVFASLVSLVTQAAENSPVRAVLNASFDMVSTITTTGITHDTRIGSSLPFELVLAIALVGGCAYSTSGGLKIFRLMSMVHHSTNEIKRLVYPHVILRRAMDQNDEELRLSKAVWSASFLTLMSLVAASLVFSLFDVGLAQSLGLAVGAFSSTGNLVGLNMGDASNGLTLAVAAFALLARIELLVVLAAIARKNW